MTREKMAEMVLKFFREQTGISTRDLIVNLDVPGMGNALGEFKLPCVILISSRVAATELPLTLFHELAHYEQAVRGDLCWQNTGRKVAVPVSASSTFAEPSFDSSCTSNHVSDVKVICYQGQPVEELPYHYRPVEEHARLRASVWLRQFDCELVKLPVSERYSELDPRPELDRWLDFPAGHLSAEPSSAFSPRRQALDPWVLEPEEPFRMMPEPPPHQEQNHTPP